jgi:nucleoside-diphosphate-sugar epimerase
MRILVTGGSGFIGSHLVELLLERGDEVFVVDDLSTGNLDNLATVRQHPNLHLNVDTILNHPMMDETVGRCDLVIHLAAAVGVRKILDEPVETITTNVRGTEILLDCCHRNEKRLFLASTSEIYGKAGDRLHEEHDRVMGATSKRRWAYACTKVLDEFLALAYNQEKGLPVIVARFFNTVGPRQAGQWGMVLPNFVGHAIRGEPLELYGTGDQLRCFCHVKDTIRAVVGLVECDDAWGRAFNIGHESEVSMRDLAERVVEMSGSSSEIRMVSYDEAYGEGFEDMQRRQPDTSRIRETIGWSPERDLDEIIRSTIEHMRAQPAG